MVSPDDERRLDLIKNSPIHYGWIVLAAGTFGSFMTLPGQTAGVSVFFDPLTVELEHEPAAELHFRGCQSAANITPTGDP